MENLNSNYLITPGFIRELGISSFKCDDLSGSYFVNVYCSAVRRAEFDTDMIKQLFYETDFEVVSRLESDKDVYLKSFCRKGFQGVNVVGLDVSDGVLEVCKSVEDLEGLILGIYRKNSLFEGMSSSVGLIIPNRVFVPRYSFNN